MSRGVYRGVHSSLFDDPDFQRLSAAARHVFLTIRLCRDAGPAVIFRYYLDVISHQTGLPRAKVEAALVELERAHWIARDGPVLWVVNGLRHDPYIRVSSPKHRAAVIRQLEGLPHVPMLATFCEHYDLGKGIVGVSNAGSRRPPSSDTDTEVLPEKDSVSPSPTIALTNGRPFRIDASILDALDHSGRLGAAPRLRSPEFWRAQIQTNGAVDLPAEVLKAEAWLCANPTRAPRKDLARFLNNWLTRAKESR